MKPTIGRTVHFQPAGTPGTKHLPAPCTAIITDVPTGYLIGDETSGLALVNPTAMSFATHVAYSPTPKPGHWNWPPRESTTAPSVSPQSLTGRSTADC